MTPLGGRGISRLPWVLARVVLASVMLLTAAVACAEEQSRTAERAPAVSQRDLDGALVDALALLGLEHGIRIAFQQKTRDALRGPFWDDYLHSVRVPQQWEDTDTWPVNYIGHPIHGAAAGIVWLDHSERARAAALFGRAYLASRGRAAAFAALYSLQFEIGPLSEASIGNVGLRPDTTGWVDYVATPVGALGLMIAEDVLDRYLVRWVESHVRNRVARATVRLAFGPSRFLANSAERRLPWYRPDRPLGWR